MEWISVKDKLPDENLMVLILTENQPIVRYAITSYDKSLDIFVDYDDYSFSATHWMLLPEPPKL